ncbi:hypothetical protein FRC17_002308, partial [Serendipita sp. 399]
MQAKRTLPVYSYKILSMHSAVGPIYRLPPEILMHIFQAYVDLDNSPWRLVCVSVVWAKVALKTAVLWRYIFLTDDWTGFWWSPPGFSRAYETVNRRQICKTKLDLEEAVRRAGSATLDVGVFLSAGDFHGQELLSHLFGEAAISSRIGWIDLDRVPMNLPASLQPPVLPRLTGIACTDPNRKWGTFIGEILSQCKGPLSIDVTLSTLIALNDFNIWKKVRSLTLQCSENGSFPPRPMILDTVIPACPALESLTMSADAVWPNKDTPPTVYEHLHALFLFCNSQNLHLIRAPVLTSLELLLRDDDTEDDAQLNEEIPAEFPHLTTLVINSNDTKWTSRLKAPLLRSLSITLEPNWVEPTNFEISFPVGGFPTVLDAYFQVVPHYYLLLAALKSVPNAERMTIVPQMQDLTHVWSLLFGKLAIQPPEALCPRASHIQFGGEASWHRLMATKSELEPSLRKLVAVRQNHNAPLTSLKVYWSGDESFTHFCPTLNVMSSEDTLSKPPSLSKAILTDHLRVGPICRLPLEILMEIFQAYVELGDSPWRLVCVSITWEKVALKTALLWRHIYLTDEETEPLVPVSSWSVRGFDQALFTIENKQLCRTRVEMEQAISRAGSAPLDVVLSLVGGLHAEPWLCAQEILFQIFGQSSISSRIHRVELAQLPTDTLSFPQPPDLPSLREIVWTGPSRECSPSIGQILSHCKGLSSMTVSFPVLSSLKGFDIWRNIRSITIRDQDDFSYENLVSKTTSLNTVISSCHSLESLEIFSYTSWPKKSTPPVICQHLRVLRLSCAIKHLHLLQTPMLTTLEVDQMPSDFDDEEGDEDDEDDDEEELNEDEADGEDYEDIRVDFPFLTTLIVRSGDPRWISQLKVPFLTSLDICLDYADIVDSRIAAGATDFHNLFPVAGFPTVTRARFKAIGYIHLFVAALKSVPNANRITIAADAQEHFTFRFKMIQQLCMQDPHILCPKATHIEFGDSLHRLSGMKWYLEPFLQELVAIRKGYDPPLQSLKVYWWGDVGLTEYIDADSFPSDAEALDTVIPRCHSLESFKVDAFEIWPSKSTPPTMCGHLVSLALYCDVQHLHLIQAAMITWLDIREPWKEEFGEPSIKNNDVEFPRLETLIAGTKDPRWIYQLKLPRLRSLSITLFRNYYLNERMIQQSNLYADFFPVNGLPTVQDAQFTANGSYG